MEIYLIRHTTPRIEKGICYGQSDVPVANSFEGEWLAIKEKLPISIDAIYSSPLSRSVALASKLSIYYHLNIIYDVRLKELNFGEWELKSWNDIDPNSLQTWMDDYINVRCPDGESYLDLADRVRSFTTELLNHNFSKVIIVTHHGVMKAMHSVLMNVNLKASMECKFAFGEIVRL
jgi:alpha-ribazole phosphatase